MSRFTQIQPNLFLWSDTCNVYILRDGARATRTRATASLLFTPSRPKHLLDAAADRKIPVG